jgi:hypothetical protein
MHGETVETRIEMFRFGSFPASVEQTLPNYVADTPLRDRATVVASS